MLAGAEARGRAYASAAVEAWPYTEPGLLGAISHAIRPVRGRTDSAIRILLAWPGFTLRGQHLTGGWARSLRRCRGWELGVWPSPGAAAAVAAARPAPG